jgi:methionyl-tRNA formyltransferase
MRILFAGSPAIALPSLETLVSLALEDETFELAGVLTNPDSVKGRHGGAEPTEVGKALPGFSREFESRGRVPPVLLKPEKLDLRAREAAARLRPDLLVSFAYGSIFGPRFLSLFPMGGINIHPSLLPKYRGPAPIPAAILGRDTETGITVQRLALEMDAGDILIQESFPLCGRETAGELSETAAAKGAALLRRVLRDMSGGTLAGRPQNHREASYCSLITKEDGRVNWEMDAGDIDARIRAYTPWPLSWTTHGDRRLNILEGTPGGQGSAPAGSGAVPGTVLGVDKNRGILVQTGGGVLGIARLQYHTKKALEWRTFLNGVRDFIGSRLV